MKIVRNRAQGLEKRSPDIGSRFTRYYAHSKYVTFTGLTDTQVSTEILQKVLRVVDGEAGHFYVQEIIANDTFVLFDKVVIPYFWGNEMAEKTFNINVVVELIQADTLHRHRYLAAISATGALLRLEV